MTEVVGDLWDYFDHSHILCLTTNGTIKRNGRGVMGRGSAKEAMLKILGIDSTLGKTVVVMVS